MARPVVKWAAEPPSAAQIPFYLERAYVVANTGRKGAVHLTIPVDLFRDCSAGGLAAGVRGHTMLSQASVFGPRGQCGLFPDTGGKTAGATVVEMLRAARRPVVIAGSGVWWSGAEDALRRFLERTSFPLYTI